MTRLRRSGFSPRLRAIAGIDTPIIVESRPSMKKAQPTTSGITIRMRGRVTVGSVRPASVTNELWGAAAAYGGGSIIRFSASRQAGAPHDGRTECNRQPERRVGNARTLGAWLSRALRELGREPAAGADAAGAAADRKRYRSG